MVDILNNYYEFTIDLSDTHHLVDSSYADMDDKGGWREYKIPIWGNDNSDVNIVGNPDSKNISYFS